jgi:putative ABC transport system permease protein
VEKTMQDVRYAFRMLRKTPGFAAAAILTLALGIGANTAIFSLVSAVLLRPLPFPEPDRLVLLWDDASSAGGPSRTEPSPADFASWKEQSRTIADMAALVSATYNLTGSGEPQKLRGIRTTANLFTVLGMQPVLGRTLVAADDRQDANRTVVISERLWRSQFGGDTAIVGRTIDLNGLPHTVVGVVPPDFQFPDKNAALWVPARFTPEELAERSSYILYVVGRLKPGVGLQEARAEMTTIGRRLAQEFPRSNSKTSVSVTELREHLTREARPAMVVLLAAVVLVLAIACVNLANLLLARATARQKEFALRKALGAGNGRVVRQLLTESALVALAGAGLGIALAPLTFTYLSRLIPNGLPSGTRPALDVSVLLFTASVTSLVTLAFGAGPALVAGRVSLDAALKSGTGRGTQAPASRRVRNVLAVVEVALTVVLLIAAGLLLRSYSNVLAVAPGFEPRHLLLAETVLPPSKYGSLTARTAFYSQVLERVRALPSVSGAGYVNYPPMTFKGGRAYFSVEGEPRPRPEDIIRNLAIDRVITAGYFQTLGVPLVRGRHLDERDVDTAPLAAVVNEKFAAARWPNRDPIGRRIRFGANGSAPWVTVVGIVANVRQLGLDMPAEAEVYLAAAQVPVDFAFFWPQHLVVRTTGDPSAVATAVRHAVLEVDPDEPVANLRSMEQVFDQEVLNRSTNMILVGVFAALALIMASVGLYGVLSYNVAQRIPEIGVRIALGAEPRAVMRMVVRQGSVVALAGIAAGLTASLAAGRLLSSFLYQVSPRDPGVFFMATATLLAVALVACWLPAMRASSVDPLTALRAE